MLRQGRTQRYTLAILVALSFAAAVSCRDQSSELPVPPGPDGSCSTETLAAIDRHDLQQVRELRKRGAIGDCPETQYALSHAITHEDTETVALVVAAGVNPNLPTADGCWPALAHAFFMRHRDYLVPRGGLATDLRMLTLLVEGGADLNAEWIEASCYPPAAYPEGRRSGAPLMMGALTGDYEFVQLLVRAGVNVDVRDTQGRSAVDYANLCRNPANREKVLSLLSEAMRARQSAPRTPK